MKLIDLLVQELPKRGGWPKLVSRIHQDHDGDVYGWTGLSSKLLFNINIIADDCRPYGLDESIENMVTHSQYESALALSRKPAWNGEGLPTVGAKVEFFINPKLRYRNAWIPDAGTEMEVVAHKTTTDGNDVAVCYWDEGGAGRSCCFVPESLKPLRTEAEMKHEAVLESICAVLEMVAQDYKRKDEAKLIYEAIAAGKIPGVKLDD